MKLKTREDKVKEEIIFRENARLLTDNQRAEYFGLPQGCRIREGAKIYYPEKFKCGKYCWFGEDCKLDASGGLEIGDHTTIGLSVFVWSHSSHLANITLNNIIDNPLIIRKKTKIGSGTFIGGPSVINAGVTIGNKCIILPLSAVTQDIPDNSLVGGAPAKILRKIDDAWIKNQLSKTKIQNMAQRYDEIKEWSKNII